MVKNIAVFGATDFLDLPITQSLLDAGYNVSIMTTDVEAAKTVFPEQVNVVEGNIKYHHDLKRFLSTQDTVYCSLSVDLNEKPEDFHLETDGLREIINASLECGIKRITYLSSILQYNQIENEDTWWVFKLKKDAVNYVRDCGIPFTIFYASTFMENFTNSYKRDRKVRIIGESRFPIYFISVKDYARVLTGSFKKGGTEDQEYFIQGQDCYTMQDAAKIFVKNYPVKNMKVRNISIGFARFLSIFSIRWKFLTELSNSLNENNEIFVAESTWDEFGKPEIKLIDFAKNSG